MMTKFTFYSNPTRTLACVPSYAPVFFSLETVAGLTGVHPEMLRYYARTGLIDSFREIFQSGLCFDESAIREIHRIEYYRRQLGVGRRALPLICKLRRESEQLRIELPFLHHPAMAT